MNSIVSVEKDKRGQAKMKVCLDPTNLSQNFLRGSSIIDHLMTSSTSSHQVRCFPLLTFQRASGMEGMIKHKPDNFHYAFGRFCFTRMPFLSTVKGDAF